MAEWPPDTTVEMFYDGQWNDVTGEVRATDPIDMVFGRRNEGASADPGSVTMKINNRHGKYSPKNPRSPLFGKIGKNTPVRVRVGEEAVDPDPFLIDTFDRTEAEGWGVADSGQTWYRFDLSGPTTDSQYAVADGFGEMIIPDDEAILSMAADLDTKVSDIDATVNARCDKRVLSASANRAVFAGLTFRIDPVVNNFVTASLWFAADSGLPDGVGLRVATSIISSVDGSNTDQVQGEVIPNLVYVPGEDLTIRVQAIGPDVRMKVWRTGDPEPLVWHSQFYSEVVTGAGDVGLLGQNNAEGVDVPVTVSFSNLEVRAPTENNDNIRGGFEISEWPTRWDLSDRDVWVPVKGNGILRRYNQGSTPIQSTLRRYIASLFPIAYWSFEETGSLGERAIEAVAGGQSMRLGGFKFAEDDDVPGSEPLPSLLESTGAGTAQFGTSPFLRSGSSPAVETGSMNVSLLVRLPADDYPEDGVHELFRFFSTGRGTEWVITAENSGDAPLLRLTIRDEDGVTLANSTAGHNAALSGGGPGLLDDWRVLSMYAIQNGGNTNWNFRWYTLDGENNWGNFGSYSGDVGHFRRVSTTFSPGLKGIRLGHISAWGVAFPVAYFNGLTDLHAALGFVGETARSRMRRIMSEEQIPGILLGALDTAMGPQNPGDLADLLSEPPEADTSFLTERRHEVAVLVRGHDTLYNQEPVLTLDYSNGEIFEPFEPMEDDQRTRNDVTIQREGGSSYNVVQNSGPLNVNAPEVDPDGVGRYSESTTINVASDDQLADLAGWRLHLGTVDELRYPKIFINLANERIRQHTDALMSVREGDMIVITNPPEWLPADDIRLIVEGYEERLSLFTWEMTLVCSPASPWIVGTTTPLRPILEDDFESPDRNLIITDGGDAAWFRTDEEARFGDWSYRSGEIVDNQTSEMTVEVPDQAVNLSFWYKVSSEVDFDFFRVYLDSGLELEVSGEVDWQLVEGIDVREVDFITFEYEKSANTSAGTDAAYIDEIQFLTLDSSPQSVDRADTTGSDLVYDIDDQETGLVVYTRQPVRGDYAEWVGSAIPLNPNGDFEENLTGWSGSGATTSRVPTPAGASFDSEWSMRIEPDGVTEFPSAGSDFVPVFEGREYTLNGWLYSTNATRQMSLNINWFDGVGGYLSTSSNDKVIALGVWTWFEVTATAPAGAENANLAPTVPNFPSTDDMLIVDQVFLRPTEIWSMPEEFPINLRLSPRGGNGGEVVAAQSIEPLVWDSFQREETASWGVADSGQQWDLIGGVDSERNVSGGAGTVTLSGAADPGAIRFQQAFEDLTNCEVLVSVSVDQIATTQSFIPGIFLRAAGSNYYRIRAVFGTNQQLAVQSVSGVTIQDTMLTTFEYDIDQAVWIRARVIDGHQLLGKVWPVGRNEPTLWQVNTFVDIGLTEHGTIGTTASAFSGNTNTDPTFSFDNFQTVTPQLAVVERGVNGFVVPHSEGYDVRLAQPSTVAL